MTNSDMLKVAIAVPGGILGTLLYKMLLRRTAGKSDMPDKAVVDRLKTITGISRIELNEKIKPWRTRFDARQNAVLANPKTHSGVLARELAVSTNPKWTHALRRTGAVMPLLGSLGAWAAPTDSLSRDAALGATALSLPRATSTILGGLKGTTWAHAQGGGVASKMLAASKIPGAVLALTAPGLAYAARHEHKKDPWWDIKRS